MDAMESAKRPRIAVVTGAGSGIGRAVAVELLRAGWSVALAGRRAGPLEETAALVPGGACLAVRTDVSQPADVTALFEAVRDRFGRLARAGCRSRTCRTRPGGTSWTPI
jgi:NAD(P)-dependent dehydrogenase (short-subunit alcohol dehydrogenase family)